MIGAPAISQADRCVSCLRLRDEHSQRHHVVLSIFEDHLDTTDPGDLLDTWVRPGMSGDPRPLS